MVAPQPAEPFCPPLATVDPTAPRRLAAEADALRDAARQLREQAAALADILRAVADFDRPDVWSGARADRFRRELVEVSRRLCSPATGAAVELLETAIRFEHRASWLDATTVEPLPPCR